MPQKKDETPSESCKLPTETLSPEEHEARAMLLGLRYHHGNGDPFYYKPEPDTGLPIVSTIVEANTLVRVHDGNTPYNCVMDDELNAILERKRPTLKRVKKIL